MVEVYKMASCVYKGEEQGSTRTDLMELNIKETLQSFFIFLFISGK